MRIRHRLAAALGAERQQEEGAAQEEDRKDQPTSSERRPDDPANGLDPVVHVCLGVGHEQEGLMADWRALLLSSAACGREGETGEMDEGGSAGVKRRRKSSAEGLTGSLLPQGR